MSPTYRVIVCGPRNYPEALTPLVAEVLDALLLDCVLLGRSLLVVHGACPHGWSDAGQTVRAWSVDQLTDDWCATNQVPVERHPADWGRLGQKAGPVRNRGMASAGAEFCIAFAVSPHSGHSLTPGTDSMANEANIHHVPLTIVRPGAVIDFRIVDWLIERGRESK